MTFSTWLFCLLCLIAAYDAWWIMVRHRRGRAADEDLALRLSNGTDPPELPSTPRISALVAAWNPEEDLERLIRSFRELDYPEKEMILAVGGAHRIEDLQHLAADDLRLIPHPGGSKQAALRECLREAGGGLIFLTDADCVLEPASFRQLVAPLARGETSVTTGRHVPLEEQRTHPLVRLLWNRSIFNFAYVSRNPGVYGPNGCLTREALRAAGDFAEELRTGQDVHLSLRLQAAGYTVRFVQSSQVQTHYHHQLLPILRQQSRWVRNSIYDAMLQGQHERVRAWWRSSILGAGFLGLTALLPLWNRWLLLAFAAGLVRRYLASLRLQLLASRMRQERSGAAQYLWPLADMYLEALIHVRAMIDHLAPSRRDRW